MLRKSYVVLKMEILNGKSMLKKYIIYIISVVANPKKTTEKIN